MRSQRVVSNETCNQNCWFCNARRPAEQADFVARAAVKRRIEAALADQPREVVITGGEPTMRSDIADLVRRAGVGGAQVVLETNAALIDARRAGELAAAGLGMARVQLVAWGPDADAITRDPGGFAAAQEGIRHLADAGVPVEVTTPVVQRNLALVAALPGQIVSARLPVVGLALVVPTEAPDAGECAALAEVSEAVSAVADAARRVGLALRLDPTTFVPPCIFARAERVAHLFALNRGNAERPGFRHVDQCTDCLVADRCPGLPVASRVDAALLRPVAEQRLRRRLTVVSTVEEQVAREYLSRDEFRGGDEPIPEYTVRVNFHCNQSCEFCFVSTHLPPAAEGAVRGAIEEAGRAGAALVLSGGEPTLNPRLAEYIRLAKASGVRAVELQSNATRLANAELTTALVDAGLDRAMISLHGSRAEISDAVTAAPGTFDATVRGIDELVRAALEVRLNFVFCQLNRRDFPSYIDYVAQRWPGIGVVFSFVGSHTDVVPRSESLIPRFADVIPSLVEGLERARAAGVPVYGFESMCGLPLCLVPEAERGAFSKLPLPPDAGGGEFVKFDVCAQCSESYRCFGVRRGYAELYGGDELQALNEDAAR